MVTKKEMCICNILFALLIFGLSICANSSFAANTLLFSNPHPYEITLYSGNESLKQELDNKLKANRDYLLALNSDISVARLADADTGVLVKALHAQAYFEGSVSLELKSEGDNAKVLKYHIVEGPRYVINTINFDTPEYLPNDINFDFEMKPGDPILAGRVLKIKDKLQKKLEEYCLLEIDLRHKVTLSKNSHTGNVRFTLRKTQKAHISDIQFSGLVSVNENYFRNRLKLKNGDCFNRGDVEQARFSLLQTNLLRKVDANYDIDKTAQADAEGFFPLEVTFDVEERKHKTVKFGLGYSTDEGAGVRIGWEHRNLFGSGEDLEIKGGSNEVRQYLDGNYRIQDFIKQDQKLTVKAELTNETTDAFKSNKAKSSATLSRNLNKHILGDLGIAFSHSEVLEDDNTESFNLLSAPVRVSIESRNNILDPTSGWHATTSLTPFTDLLKENVRFLQWTANGSVYLSANVSMQPTLALRMSMGASTGTALENIPADERFYVGGGGSVRGYAYQTVGNLTDKEADGGKSFAETTAELRFKVSKSWGAVLFLDGGYAYPNELPKFGTDFLWGAGIGLRYYTSFAPIRFDLAKPINRREGIDDSLQFYASIGQSF